MHTVSGKQIKEMKKLTAMCDEAEELLEGGKTNEVRMARRAGHGLTCPRRSHACVCLCVRVSCVLCVRLRVCLFVRRRICVCGACV